MGSVSVPSSRGEQQERSRRRREEILRAALTIIGRDGLAGVTHRAVAAEAGVPLGSLTYYFPTKEELLAAALDLFVDEEVAFLRAVSDSMEGLDLPLEEVAERMARAIEAKQASDPAGATAQFVLYLEARRDPALRAAAERCFRAYDEVARAALRVAGVADPAVEVAFFVAMSDGLGLRRMAAPDGAPALEHGLVGLLRGAQAGATSAGGASR